MERAPKLLVLFNLCLWIYFWVAFTHSAYPFRHNPLGHPAGNGYTFWGHSIAVVESPLSYPFFEVVLYAGFPSFLLGFSIAHLMPISWLDGFWAGISGDGWVLLAVMALTFFQWYLVGWAMRKLWRKHRS
jgi:hypothetical protein